MSWAPTNLPARVGACEPCSQGKACSCTTPCTGGSCARGTSAYVYPGGPLPSARVGAIYVSDAELDALGSEISLMGADVNAAVAAQESNLPAFEGNLAHAVWQLCKDEKGTWDYKTQKCDFAKPDPQGLSIGATPGTPPHPLTKYRLERWTPYQMKWNAYRDQTIHEPTVYDILRTEFKTLIDEWQGMGQQTRAKVPPSLSDPSKDFEFPWGWLILGSAIVLFPFYLPALVGTYYYVKNKGKVPAGLL